MVKRIASSASVGVKPAAREQAPLLADLLERYAHELSGMFQLEKGADGRYGYPLLPAYWRDEGRYPFFMYADDELAGFALVAKGSQVGGGAHVYDMAEFFVAPAFRKRGVGAAAARQIWKRLAGAWEIRVLDANAPALAFWRAAVRSHVEMNCEVAWLDPKQRPWRVLSFAKDAAT